MPWTWLVIHVVNSQTLPSVCIFLLHLFQWPVCTFFQLKCDKLEGTHKNVLKWKFHFMETSLHKTRNSKLSGPMCYQLIYRGQSVNAIPLTVAIPRYVRSLSYTVFSFLCCPKHFFGVFFIPFIVVILSVCNCVITPLLLLLFIWRCKSQQKRVFIFVCLCTNVFLGHSRQRHCNISKSLVVSNSWWPLQNEAETPSICFARNNSLGGWHAVPYKLCMTHIELPRELLSCLKINTSAPLL